jgi:hypothetical protein
MLVKSVSSCGVYCVPCPCDYYFWGWLKDNLAPFAELEQIKIRDTDKDRTTHNGEFMFHGTIYILVKII